MLTSQVFVSHTSDMSLFPRGRSFVQAVLDGIGRAGMAPVDMRYFAARDGAPVDYCLQRVRACEIYVAVVGFRYGSLVPGSELSYTEAEFLEASAAGIPRLVFLLDEGAELPDGAADSDRSSVDQFRRRLGEAGLVLAGFATPEGLELEVYHALDEAAKASFQAASALEIRHSLPPDTAAFTGRRAELEQITLAAVPAVVGGGGVGICAIVGMPGAGKTALAVHAAHLLRERFPDRQLFVDLHAHTPGQEPARPVDALAGLLTATGADPRFLPADLGGRAAMWRDRMAGQEALLVLDNASSSEQIAPLLPGDAGCLVLVTSRRYLGDLPGAVTPVPLDVLAPLEAQEMFTQLAPRAAGYPDEVAEMARLAGFLPLAIRLLARMFARHASWTLADLAAETRAGLLGLASENDSIAAAFEVSYRYLDPVQQRLFCLLGVHPGTSIDAYAAAALAETGPESAFWLLDRLDGEGLLTEVGHRRYGMHDLIRRYAIRMARAASAPHDIEPALNRELNYYLRVAQAASAYLPYGDRSARAGRGPLPQSPPSAVGDLSGALRWLGAERHNLLACAALAVAQGRQPLTVAFSSGLAAWLRYDGTWELAITLHAAASEAALALGDEAGRADAQYALGVRSLTGDFDGAADALEKALDIYRHRHDVLGEADVLTEMAILRRLTGQYEDCLALLSQALELYAGAGHQPGQAAALKYTGVAKRITGDYAGAESDLNRALDLYQGLDDAPGRASVLDNLGILRYLRDDFPGAIHLFMQALTIFRQTDARLSEANCLNNLATARRLSGEIDDAIRILGDALPKLRRLGNRLGEANCLSNLGFSLRLRGDLGAAEAALQQSLSIYDSLGHKKGHANALIDLGGVRGMSGDNNGALELIEQGISICRLLKDKLGRASGLTEQAIIWSRTGQHDRAIAALSQAYRLYGQLGDGSGRVEILNQQGKLLLDIGEIRRSRTRYRLALRQSRQLHSKLEEARALEGLGRAAQAEGKATAQATMNQALEIYQRIGAAEATSLAAHLEQCGALPTG